MISPPVAPAPAQARGYSELVLNEEFEGEKRQLFQRWALGLWFHGNKVRRKEVKLKDGIASITARKGPYQRNTMLSGWSADGKIRQTFRFGYFEARMRWPARRGNWANFWLESEEAAKVPYQAERPPYCEIDIVEAVPGGYKSVIHDWLARKRESDFNIRSRTWTYYYRTFEWHTYAALWQPGRVTFYFDGKVVNSVKPPKTCDEQRMFIVFGTQRRFQFAETSDFDWIRVWQ